jgi:hypothetical protein
MSVKAKQEMVLKNNKVSTFLHTKDLKASQEHKRKKKNMKILTLKKMKKMRMTMKKRKSVRETWTLMRMLRRSL